MTPDRTEVQAARAYLAGLSDDRAVQIHRWLAAGGSTGGTHGCEQTPGQLAIDEADVEVSS